MGPPPADGRRTSASAASTATTTAPPAVSSSPSAEDIRILGSSMTGGAMSVSVRPGSMGAVTVRSSDGLSSPPSAVHTSDTGRSSGGGMPMATTTGRRPSRGPVSTSEGRTENRRKQERTADSRRCSSSGRWVQAVTR